MYMYTVCLRAEKNGEISLWYTGGRSSERGESVAPVAVAARPPLPPPPDAGVPPPHNGLAAAVAPGAVLSGN